MCPRALTSCCVVADASIDPYKRVGKSIANVNLQFFIAVGLAQRLVVDDVHRLGGRGDGVFAGKAARAEAALAVDGQLLHMLNA